MKLKENIKSITYMKTKASQLIKEVQKNHYPIVITQKGEAKAVIMDIDSFEQTQQALLMLKLLVQGEKDISNGNILENEIVMKNIERKLISKK